MDEQQLPNVDDVQLPEAGELPELEAPASEDPGLSLADVAEGSAPSTAAPVVAAKPTAAMSPEQVIGLVANLTGATLPAEVRAEYVTALKGDELVKLGVMASGMCEALAEYGIGAEGGKLPPWAALLVGAGVLGFGVYNHRGIYAAKAQQLGAPTPGPGPGGFDYGGAGGITSANITAGGVGAGV